MIIIAYLIVRKTSNALKHQQRKFLTNTTFTKTDKLKKSLANYFQSLTSMFLLFSLLSSLFHYLLSYLKLMILKHIGNYDFIEDELVTKITLDVFLDNKFTLNGIVIFLVGIVIKGILLGWFMFFVF